MSTAAMRIEQPETLLHESFLDDVIPLQGASHADVVRYSVEVPMRYAECFGVLADGRKVPLTNKRHFVAWSGHNEKRSLLFDTGEFRVEANVDPADQLGCLSPGNITGIEHEPSLGARLHRNRGPFIATDGNVFA